MRRTILAFILGLLGLSGAAPGMASAQHRLASGDVVQVTVFRVPEMDVEARVDIDGRIAIPPLGNIDVEGRTVDEVQTMVADRLAEDQVLLDAAVTVALTSVRPIVVGGHVADPGAIAFEPGLDARRAIALAGGLGSFRDADRGVIAELRGNRAETMAALDRAQMRLERIEAELSGVDRLESGGTGDGPDGDIQQTEQRILSANKAEAAEEKAYLERNLDLVTAYIGKLQDSLDRYTPRIEAQKAEFERVRDVQDRGLTVSDRVLQESRVLSDLIEDASEIEAAIIAAQERRAGLQHQIGRFDERRAATLMLERQETGLTIDTLSARLDGIDSRLRQSGLVDEDSAAITIHRIAEDGQTRAIPADQDTVLEPGDYIEVDLSRSPEMDMATQ